ncbi:cytochrome P450 [Russula ochroleuca]|uniref:Cytochrome P450 n=1 Tax=Russula ochroleuca TaxID=152965 RepID=A0A9P5MPW4_9AGAM|nr:cytochrome P450 [Russula ochroleuca]
MRPWLVQGRSSAHGPFIVKIPIMPSLSASLFGLLEDLKHSLLQLRLRVQDYGTFSIGVVLSLIVLYTARYLTSPFRKLPPGPRGYPIIGNIFQLKAGQWLKFAEWQKKYGNLIYLNVAGQPVVVINSQRAGVRLLDGRAAIYSDRPRNVVACDIMTGGLFFGFSRYGDTWRRMRKAADERFSKSSVKGFYETQMTEAVLLAHDGLVNPAQWDWHLRRAAASMTLSVLYGYPTLTSGQEHVVKAINDFSKRIATMGAHWVQIFPWLQHVPGSLAKWKRNAEAWYKQDSAMFEDLFNTVETNVAKGDDSQSVGATVIHEVEKNKLSSLERSWLAGTLYVGGADTTSSMLAWWTLAILAYPETQARAQAEIDAVVGRARLPTFADYPHLPYVRAMVKEVLRWRPVAPLAAPHQSTEDDWYEGMFIPKGTICIPNLWHMNRDPEVYGQNTEDFDPARYLDATGEIAPGESHTREEGHFSYGFGRRICVGRYMADNSLFINIAVLLWAIKIERKVDASGQLLPLDIDGFVDHGVVVRPAPFECEITPRFPEAPALLVQERELRGL